MPTFNTSGTLTMADLAAQLESANKLTAERAIIDLALERNDIIKDLPFQAANNGDTNITHYRIKLPDAVWGRIYKGVRSSKGAWATSRNVASTLKSKMEFADELYRKSPDRDSFIRRHAGSHVDAMMMEMAQMLIYGDLKDNPDGFNGLMKYYDRHTSNNDKEPAFNVINAGGSKDFASILLVGWGGDSTYCFFPQGESGGGVRVGDMSPRDLRDPDDPSATIEGWVQYFYWSLGLDVVDWRKNGRICNIDRTAHQGSGDLKDPAGKFFQRLDSLTARVDETGTRQVLYMDPIVWEQAKVFAGVLTRQNAVTEQNLNGHRVLTLNGLPVRICKAMNVTETQVTAS